ncbi:unnamed protein product [Heligmosomoides polygyrus]|uniref:Solute carrier organic anion transporter family member n=1 Tax=Heligmosomoides polygyrus TaxID=6339 RepID=A0A3P7ZIU8_HELPZ|nr:unnamed protein product [Heligmosomoides polygyrus]
MERFKDKYDTSDEELRDKSEDEDKLLCGYGSCTPQWLQRFHNAKCLLLMLGICAFIQSFVVNAIFPVGLSTLEKRFKMTSTHTGIISSWYDFAVLLVVFPVCHWGNSVGSTPLFSIGTTFIDENVSQKASPVYLAIHAVLTSFGPVIGVFVGGFLLNIYDDFDRVDHPPITRSDPRWIGAWWIGFLASSISALVIAFPILAFARELPEAKHHRAKDVNQCHAVAANPNEKAPKDAKKLPIKICRNPTFVVCIMIGIFESIIINGFAAFMPKILETLLSTTPMIASYLSSVVIFAAAAGVMVGGMVIRKLQLQMIIVCHVIALIFTTGLLVHCPQRQFVGVNTDYGDAEIHSNVEHHVVSECNEDCSCKVRLYYVHSHSTIQ